MNSEAFINTDIAPRPKINRLPLASAYDKSNIFLKKKEFIDNYSVWRYVYFFGAVALLVVFLIIYKYSAGVRVAVVSPDDAHLMSLIESSDDAPKAENSELYFKDSGGVIVGQMVNIAAGLEKQPVSRVTVNRNDDPAVERDLLKIVDKH